MELSHIAVLMKGGKDTPKEYFERPAKDFMKAGKHIRKIPKPGGGYRYVYQEPGKSIRQGDDSGKDISKINKRIKVLNDKIKAKRDEIKNVEDRINLLSPRKGAIEKSTAENMTDGADGPITGDLDFISQGMLGKAQHARNKRHKMAGLDSTMQSELGVPL